MTQTIGGVEYMDAGEAAAMLSVKKATLYAYVSRGVLRSYKQGVGRKRLYRRAEVELLRSVHLSNESAVLTAMAGCCAMCTCPMPRAGQANISLRSPAYQPFFSCFLLE